MKREIVANDDARVCRVFVVRHARTDWNARKILQGHVDIDINADGAEQARRWAAHMRAIPLDRVVSSDLARCVSTVAELARLTPLDVATTRDLRERNMGEVQGMPLADAMARYGPGFRNLGEQEPALVARVSAVWDRTVADAVAAGHRNTLVCTHGGVITAFANHLHRDRGYALADGVAPDDLRVPYNTSVTIVDIDRATGKGTIQRFGLTEHLGGDFRVANQMLR